MEQYARVIVDISLEKLDRAFTYRIPEALLGRLEPGMQVEVPFGKSNRVISGYVLELTKEAGFDRDKIKEIREISKKGIQIEGQLIRLAAWIRHTYGSTMNQALKTVLPVKRQVEEKQKRQVRLLLSEQKARELLDLLERKSQLARFRVLAALLDTPCWEYGRLLGTCRVSAEVLRKMEEMDILRIEQETLARTGIPEELPPPKRIVLNERQRQVTEQILEGWEAGDMRPCLIHGVTGSGKTEIYMELIADTLRRGREAILLIPEIALTYQTVRRFCQRFGDQVAVLHSRLSQGERHDQFELARKGKLKLMIGPRSALFTPFPKLGIIIMDEEHENSYKSEMVPRYHTRETAVYRASLADARVVLGSATPSMEAYYRASRGEYRLLVLKERVEKRPLPQVEVVDLRQELREGNRSMFSGLLRQRMRERLERGEQMMLFLNRRGFAGFVSCRTCGHVIKCPHCDVSLSLHRGGVLRCHYCGYEKPAVSQCPSCGSGYIGAFRAGTQQVEEAVRREFSGARVLRMDADTTRNKDGYEQILGAFSRGEADVLLGTQMIVKGHDFPGVTLVGVLAADLSLHAADYRAAERTFQLLTQAAGRAGRGERPGQVVIQTYCPEHYSVEAAARQDYEGFYKKELLYRRLMGYPPVQELLAVYLSGADQEELEIGAAALKTAADMLNQEGELQVVGPGDGMVAKVQDQYRKVLYIKGEQEEKLKACREGLEQTLKADCFASLYIQFDKNPVSGY
ncbi:MAG: primosomal protein N' [Lachnospiraceae bacterium]|nr:primosomal protein N' [Lachnospiraceae bacterium]